VKIFRRLTVRLRIAIGSVLVATVLYGALVVVFRAQVESILSSSTTTVLRHDLAPWVQEITANPPATINAPGRGQLVAVIDPSHAIRQNSMPPELTALIGSMNSDVNRVSADGSSYLVLNETVATTAGFWHVLAARNLDSSGLSLDRITQALMVSAAVLVVIVGVAAWFITRAALRPVTRMRRHAEALVSGASVEPLPIGDARDELSALGITLNELITSVRQSVEREKQLVSDASHELRSPLAVLMTQLELAHLNSGDAAALEAEITAAQRSVARISALAQHLLELSELESARGQELGSWSQLSNELATVVDRMRARVAATAVTVDFDVMPTALQAQYPISAVNFGRLVTNLTDNAITALAGTGSVVLAMRQSDAWLVLTVVDTGPGVPEEFIPVAFDRFSRPDSGRQRSDGGSGLGLAIVHAIVHNAGGTVALGNSGGLTVTVSIPRIAG
jgi:signal transduction histidine kinase